MNCSQENLVDDVLDALETAKKAHALLPPLPSNIKPIHVRVLRAIQRVRDDDGNARITEINNALGFSLPNTTRFINELTELGVVEKSHQLTDKRVVLVHASEDGERYIRDYVLSYHTSLQQGFEAIGKEDCLAMIETMNKVYKTMQKIYQDKN